MRTTRSTSSNAASTTNDAVPGVSEKRKAEDTSSSSPPASVKKPRKSAETSQPSAPAFVVPPAGPAPVLVPAVLTFSFEDARRHLVTADPRFDEIFEKLSCKPFEKLESVHPFRALVTSILGQQISWKAARSICLKFVRLYEPSIPEDDWEQEKSPTSFFPSPEQVVLTDVAVLRTAGLSVRKAEYIRDVAARFADGRLSTQKLLAASDEELAEMLIAVRGVGRWTVDMFAMFSLRRPDILPTGDLGIQRGMLRWFLAQHSPKDVFSISPDKTARSPNPAVKPDDGEDSEELPIFGAVAPLVAEGSPTDAQESPSKSADVGGGALAAMPTPFTPSINALLHATPLSVRPLPEGLTATVLKTRLVSKKKIKGAFLTPKEMEDLTVPWKPYRSLGVYYMWALADPKDAN